MRLTTIWTMPTMTIRERAARTVDEAAQAAARRLPARVRYWTAMQAIARATADRGGRVMATPIEDVIQRLDGGPR